ncbi:MAG: hypothetical protein AB7P37_18595 [Ramlibacter sp.]
MYATRTRLRLALVIFVWLAQALLPVAHAVSMSAPMPAGQAWCGDPSSAQEALALLPPEVREALDDAGVNGEHLAHCALLCAAGTVPGLSVPAAATVEALRAAGLEPAPAPVGGPVARAQSPTPPAHAPPAQG